MAWPRRSHPPAPRPPNPREVPRAIGIKAGMSEAVGPSIRRTFQPQHGQDAEFVHARHMGTSLLYRETDELADPTTGVQLGRKYDDVPSVGKYHSTRRDNESVLSIVRSSCWRVLPLIRLASVDGLSWCFRRLGADDRGVFARARGKGCGDWRGFPSWA